MSNVRKFPVRQPPQELPPGYRPPGPAPKKAVLDAPPPPVESYHDHPVTWLLWEEGLRITHIDTVCEDCGEDPGPRWMASGLVDQGPGTVPNYQVIPAHRKQRNAVVYTYGRKPKPPLRQLAASRCPACGAVDVIDMLAPDCVVWSSSEAGQS